jgi:hypothetical protein
MLNSFMLIAVSISVKHSFSLDYYSYHSYLIRLRIIRRLDNVVTVIDLPTYRACMYALVVKAKQETVGSNLNPSIVILERT